MFEAFYANVVLLPVAANLLLLYYLFFWREYASYVHNLSHLLCFLLILYMYVIIVLSVRFPNELLPSSGKLFLNFV